MQKFKASPHSCSQLITGCENKPLTEKQLAEMKRLQEKDKLTDLQKQKLTDFEWRHSMGKYNYDTPLSEGAKNHAIEWFKTQLYGKRKPQITSKEILKGLAVEDESIAYASKVLGWGDAKKNEEQFENEYFIGTPDLILDDKIIDLKNAYNHITFPLFQTEVKTEYFWQMQAYMALTGKRKAEVVYTLMDVPERDIERIWYSINNGIPAYADDGEMLPEYKEFRKDYIYTDVKDDLRVKVFEVEYDEEAIKLLENRVKLVREYINSL